MAKKIVRGITDVKTINNQDYDTNNVNDLLSDGQYNYIHRKKGKSEEYHNLTDNIKTISSDNTDLLTVTNNNKTNNTATLHPKHDAQKEQVLESTRNTVTIHHGTNGTPEKTTVDTNPEKVLEHDNLHTYYGISKSTVGNTTTLGIEYTRLNIEEPFDLNNLENGRVRSNNFLNAPKPNTWYFVSSFNDNDHTVQKAITLEDFKNTTYIRTKQADNWGQWREQVGDKSVIDALLAQKQNKLQNNTSIGVVGTGLMQLYNSKQEYTHDNGSLMAYVKWLSDSTNPEGYTSSEFNFFVKINNGQHSVSFNLNGQHLTMFNKIMTKYGSNNNIIINDCLFTLSDNTLTVSNEASTENNSIITFSSII